MQDLLAAETPTFGAFKYRVSQLAASLFVSRGFDHVTMRDIAEAASVQEEMLYAHFGTKQDIVLFIYQCINTDWRVQVDELAPADIATRFRKALLAKVDLLEPYKVFVGTITDALTHDGPLSVNSPQTTHVRTIGVQSIDAIIDGSTDGDHFRSKIESLSSLLFAAQWAVILIHLRAANRSKTEEIIELVVGALQRLDEDPSALASFAPVAHQVASWLNDFLHQSSAPDGNLDHEILRIIFNNRKLVNPRSSGLIEGKEQSAAMCSDGVCITCLRLHESKIRYFTSQQLPIHFVLPAFPAKSPNTAKVLGKLPDLGEEVALVTLQTMCKEIQSIYPPGAMITICSDGRIFSDLVEVSDSDVTDYVESVKEMIDRNRLTAINIVNLEDLLDGGTFDELRTKVLTEFSEDLDDLHARLAVSDEFKGMFNGIHRFIADDRQFLYPDVSKTKIKEQSKLIALKVIQHSNAWTRFLANVYPTSVRLSIHPYPAHSDKIGVRITKATDSWLTPWHGVIVLQEDGYVLMKRGDAEALGARVVNRHGRPYFYSSVSDVS